MPRYTPITTVMPLASMVTGAPVTSALCDQIDDNLAALYEGVWFRATKSTTTTIGSFTLFVMDTLVVSDTATDMGCISLVSGTVQTTLTGHWWVGGNYSTSGTTGVFGEILLGSTDSVVFVAEMGQDYAQADFNCSAFANVTSATNQFALYGVSGGTPSVSSNSLSPILWGVYMGDV